MNEVEINIVSRGIKYSKINYNGFIVHRIGFREKKGIERFNSIWERAHYALKCLVYILLKFNDVNLVISMHFVANFIAFLFHLISRKKYICEMVDFAFDAHKAVECRKSILNRIPNILLEYLECKVIPKFSERVIVISDIFKNALVKKYAIKKQKISVIYEGIDPRILIWEKIKNIEKLNKIKQIYGLKNKIIIMTTGFFDRYDRVDILIKAFKILKKRYYNLKLIIAGDGDEYFKALIAKETNNDITVTGWQKRRRDAYHILHLADICVISMDKRLGTDIIHSSKLMDYIAFKKPIVTLNLKAIGEIVKQYGIGRVVKNANPSELASAIEDVLRNIDDFSEIEFNVLINKFSLENISKKYLWLIEKLVPRAVPESLPESFFARDARMRRLVEAPF